MRVLLFSLILLLTISITVLASPEFSLIYVIQEGDTLSEIAADYGVSTRELLELNNLHWNSMIRVGQELLIPKKKKGTRGPGWSYRLIEQKINRDNFRLDVGEVYSVRINPDQKLPDVSHIPKDKIITYHVGVGDTLYDLARSFNTTIGVIMALNNKETSIIRVGETLRLPIHNLTPRQVLAKTITDEEFELLARVIHGEARGEPFIGQVAVGAVVINRVLDPYFPNTIREVIYQKNQFSCVNDGQINLKPNSSAYKAAREALNGTDPTMGSLYFYNPRTAKFQWWFETRRKTVTIGNHVFTL